MSNVRNLNLGTAMLQRGKLPVQQSDDAVSPHVPVSEMAMVLTLDQLRPNPDNPRNAKNPRYEDIKASVRARGLDSVPKVTLDPDGDGVYIFSDGGNTRYQILCELWQETGDERFYRVHTIFKPWPGRLKCLIGHLAENEVRGDLIFIDKAFGVHKARVIYEEQLGRSVTLRELSELLGKEGYPIDNSSVSRMEDTLNYIYPYMPRMLESGMSRGQVMPLLSLRSSALKVWKSFSGDVKPSVTLDDVFGETCRVFDEPDSYSLEVFRDEFIGQLLKALPHQSLNYDRWLIELDPKEQKRREQFGEPPAMPSLTLSPFPERSGGHSAPLTVLPDDTTSIMPVIGLCSGTLTGSTRPEPAPEPAGHTVLPYSNGISAVRLPRNEIQNDLFGGHPVITGDAVSTNSEHGADLVSAGSHSLVSAFSDQDDTVQVAAGSVSFAETGLEPVSDIWLIPAMQDDVEHLQDMAYRLVYEIAEGMGCVSDINEDKSAESAGFSVSGSSGEFSLFLAGLSGRLPDKQCNMFMFCLNFFGSQEPADTPVFNDVMVVKMMRLIRIIRRLRELQRLAAKGGENV
ncbi:ParB family protein [Pantoea sp. PNA 03-3]|uniref:ParB family protein n=1 Tax=Pantoea sp. PNA 03-3 TaxID=2135460 RepID=UPI000D754B53|nr:ParB family protein [Pantoea sp. PNA 03-3]PXV76845.1 ParB family protein of integrating conjugative element (PFGI_1 class) [Pantoea sp. PNA 03-3]